MIKRQLTIFSHRMNAAPIHTAFPFGRSVYFHCCRTVYTKYQFDCLLGTALEPDIIRKTLRMSSSEACSVRSRCHECRCEPPRDHSSRAFLFHSRESEARRARWHSIISVSDHLLALDRKQKRFSLLADCLFFPLAMAAGLSRVPKLNREWTSATTQREQERRTERNWMKAGEVDMCRTDDSDDDDVVVIIIITSRDCWNKN